MDQIQAFCNQQKEWLEAELVSSRQETASSSTEEGRSRVLSGLNIAQVSVGLYGRTVVEVGVKDGGANDRLPAHRFTSGDEVELRGNNGKANSSTQGVVSLVTETSLALAVSGSSKGKKKDKKKEANDDQDDPDEPFGEPPFTLVPSSSVEVHRKMVAALSTLSQQGAQHPLAGAVVQALFEPKEMSSSLVSDESTEAFRKQLSNPNLDNSQIEAIQFALQPERVVSLIHGPPGTGKTTTVVELIRQAVKQYRWRVLVTAPSNVAVDNVLGRLVETAPKSGKKDRLRVVRLGHPARLQANILPYSLEAQVQAADGTEIVADVRKELATFLKLLSHSKYETRSTARREVKNLRKEIRQREEGVVKSILQNAQVVLATTVGAAAKILDSSGEFDLVVIDEAAQALEASCWIPILRGRRLVLAGDHCQLPPTIQSSQPAVMKGLGETLFERIMHLYGDHLTSNLDRNKGTSDTLPSTGKVSRMLKVQYRMNQTIADWASKALYGGQLQTHESVATQTLSEILNFTSEETSGEDVDDLKEPLLLVDTAGCAFHEEVNGAGSRLNRGEAEIVRQHVAKLIKLGLRPPQIAVITPYNGQVEILRNLLLPDYPNLEIRSVDGFQGGERQVVVLSLVRSSARGGMDGIGFLKDDRRLNVAVTRAQRHCCVVADSETVSQSPFVKRLLDWIGEHGETRSALEFTQDTNETQISNDLAIAELELAKLMKQTTVNGKKDSEEQAKASSKAHKELVRTVEDFAKTNAPGSELCLSSELSSRDRRIVHELAESLGINHRSEGTDGVDRRIILSIPEAEVVPASPGTGDEDPQNDLPSETETSKTSVNRESTDIGGTLQSKPSNFDALVDSSDDEDESSKETRESRPVCQEANLNETVESSMNSVLGNLAQERARRELEKHKATATHAVAQPNPTKSLPKQLGPKKKGKKVGGAKKPKSSEKDDAMDDLDDMAFLDAQINKVQNSHGRKVDGKGSYKSIVNGILLAKPQERAPPKNTRASASLKTKIKEAQDGRKTQPKKKKK